MRLRLPGRSRDETDPHASDGRHRRPPRTGPSLEPGAEVTAAPAPTGGPRPEARSARPARLAIASAQFLLIAAAVVVLFWVLGKLWSILLPIVLGLLIATVLWPTTRFLRKHRWPPALAASTVLLVAVALFVGIIAAIAPSVADQVTELSDAATTRAAGRPGVAAGPAVQLRRGPDRQRRRLGHQLDPGQRAEHRRVRAHRRLRRRQQPAQPGPGAGAGVLLPQGRAALRAVAVRADRPAGRAARGGAVLQVLGHPVGVHPPAGPGRLHRRVLHRPRAVDPRRAAGHPARRADVLRRVHPDHRRVRGRRLRRPHRPGQQRASRRR